MRRYGDVVSLRKVLSSGRAQAFRQHKHTSWKLSKGVATEVRNSNFTMIDASYQGTRASMPFFALLWA